MRRKILYLKVLLLFFLLLSISACNKAQESQEVFKEESYEKENETKIVEMTTNDRTDPLGIDENLYFSWKMDSSIQGQKQTAYQIIVSGNGFFDKSMVWDSGKIISDKSVAIFYEGDNLVTGGEYKWQVKVWDKDGEELISSPAYFEMGKLEKEWEYGKWIKASLREENYKTWRNNQSFSLKRSKDDKKSLFLEEQKKRFDETVGEITYEFSMEDTHTGFLWSADNSQYGTYYKWSFEASSEGVWLGISYMKGEEKLKEDRKLLEGLDTGSFLEQKHNVRIVVKGDKADTFLDGILVSEDIVIMQNYVGGIGFWVTRGEYHAWYDNVRVMNDKGEVVYQEDFEGEKNIFHPYYVRIEEGKARTDAGYLMVPGMERPAPMFRKEFETKNGKKVISARAYITALGIYDFYLNGEDVNDYYAAPGQSVYSKEVYYRTYNVTENIKEGKNVLGILLGHGRYDRAKGSWGEDISLCMELVILYEDGTKQVIGTDESWSVNNNGPIRKDDFYHGELYDAFYENKEWMMPGFQENKDEWQKAVFLSLEREPIKKAAPDNGIVCVDIITPISFSEPEKGVFVYDFGKNINGICQLTMKGHENDVATMRYAELLNQENLNRKDGSHGTIWTRNLGTSENTDYYIFNKSGEVTYQPTLIYRGFRYLQLTGIEEAPPVEQVKAFILATDNEKTGSFECSDEEMNRLYEAIYLSQLNNYVDIPTDCPQRDERLGWAGDAQVYARTGSFNSYTANFIYKYIDILRASRNEKGAYPHIAPFWEYTDAANGWSDAGIILVWEMYQQYGNKKIIEENLSAMCRYMDHLVETSDNYIRNGKGYNDHNAASYMDDACCNTAQCTYVADLLTKMCQAVGEDELEEKYKEIYHNYLKAFRDTFLMEDGSIGQWLPSEYVMALAYGLYPEELAQAGAEKLNISLQAGEYKATTGYLTTPHILSVLCKYGFVEEAYTLIQQKEFPSWNYMVEKGNGTLMEGWYAFSEDEKGKITINGSLNHLALGAVGQWFYTDVLGIKRDENNPSYKHFYLEPQIGGGLTFARGSYNSIYGKIESSWEVKKEGTVFSFVIPPNTTATVTLPGGEVEGLLLEPGKYEFVVDVYPNASYD